MDYSKYINVDHEISLPEVFPPDTTGFEYVLSLLYEITQTSYSQTNLEAVTMIPRKEVYVVKVSWNWVTILALVVAIGILVCIIWQALIWVNCTKASQQVQWNLLETLELLAYVAAVDGLKEAFGPQHQCNDGEEIALGPHMLRLQRDCEEFQ